MNRQILIMRFWIFLFAIIYIFKGNDFAFALKNPAAVYCEALGYEYITFYEEKGIRGACKLPNNPVDAWDFLKGKVAQEYSYCVRQGYEMKTIKDAKKCASVYLDECAVCVLEDGTEVEVTELMGLNFAETACGDGTCGLPENYANCPEDCPSGGWDGYCDKVKDGIIDPDCKEGEDPDEQPAITGDLDGDGDVDRDDLNILLADRNKTINDSACGEACDLDGDGVITVLDARKLVLLCTRPRCATE
ncbi:protein containing DUF333 [Candidatus Desulfofervidus auxilii]|uniref:Protein containing DUF333 n=1 Tax=Desulfofervidus auxilii TaxID=1621989 RepID=A0A7U4QM38_DESA2|nr:DUF333 domain-containing protein [Candidatus Desulfofervidus auxilii]AMM41862.1 protein containing DUF333 [Candidatus Desulfofervidus auxilii]CAD7779934.1 hypothetical protein BLFGPEAP_02409 [Candidatus Methanoperedenaceae archaeon GB50]CAD7781234.1 hypothetical protein DMNBHIDG_02579 [Candidatus Methanoperedenaceae archaeon GB37]